MVHENQNQNQNQNQKEMVIVARRKRRDRLLEFKAKAALAALKEDQTLTQLTQHFDVHTNQITAWERQFLVSTPWVGNAVVDAEAKMKELHAKIGELKMGWDFF